MAPQPVADPTAPGGTLTLRVALCSVLLAAVLTASAGSAADLAASTRPYRDAEAAGAAGSVSALATADPPRPGAPEAPVPGVEVTLLPRSEEVLERLDEIKRTARRDLDAWRVSGRAVLGVQRAYETDLTRAGAADLVRSGTTDAGGRAVLTDVPAGTWLLIARRAVYQERPGDQAGRGESRSFRLRAPLQGYSAITVWLREVRIEPGGEAVVELTDRNAWMVAIEERPR